MTAITYPTPEQAEALAALRTALGTDAVITDGALFAELVDPYEPESWGGQRSLCIVQPTSTEDVQAVMRIANQYDIPVWVGSQGRNNGYGGSGTIVDGSIIINMRQMNQVLEINEDFGYVVVEPGVSFNQLYAEVQAQGKKVLIDTPDLGWGSLIGNAADHGYGYTKYGDRARSICGLEVVLPTGEVIRTGMWALPGSETAHLYPKGYGPDAEQIFLQSNYGIITKAGFWVMPTPETYFSGVIRVEEDEQLDAMVDALRPLMLDGTIPNIPSGFMGSSAMTYIGQRKDFWDGDGPIPEEVLAGVREQTGVGYWMCRFALYGRETQVDESMAAVKAAMADLPGVSVLGEKMPGDKIDERELDQGASVQGGKPDMSMLSMINFAGDNGGHVGFSSVVPTTGKDVRSVINLVREAADKAGVDYAATLMFGPRYAVHVFLAFLDRDDDEHTRHVYQVCRDTVQVAAEAGYGEYRSHTSTMDVVAAAYSWNDGALGAFNEKLKDALDPNSILMPGRSGIWGAKYRDQPPSTPWNP